MADESEAIPPAGDPRSRFRPAPTYPKAEAEQEVVVMRHELRHIADDLENMSEPVSAGNAVSFFIGLSATLVTTVLAGLADAREWVEPVFWAVAIMGIVTAVLVWYFSRGSRQAHRTERERIVARLRELDERYPDTTRSDVVAALMNEIREDLGLKPWE